MRVRNVHTVLPLSCFAGKGHWRPSHPVVGDKVGEWQEPSKLWWRHPWASQPPVTRKSGYLSVGIISKMVVCLTLHSIQCCIINLLYLTRLVIYVSIGLLCVPMMRCNLELWRLLWYDTQPDPKEELPSALMRASRCWFA